jgi:hypothetical protein
MTSENIKERQDEIQFSTKIDGFLSSISCWMLMYFFAGFFSSDPLYEQTQSFCAVFCVVFFLLYREF